VVTQADAAEIRAAFAQRGEFAAAELRNRADKLRAYAKQKKDHELHRWMGEIFCRATLRYGELSKGMDKAKVVGGRGGKAELRLPSGGKSKQQQIKASGLSKSAAHRAEAPAGARSDLDDETGVEALGIALETAEICIGADLSLALLRGHPGIDIEPGARAGAETRLRRCGLADVSASVCHVQLRLLIGDVCAGHLGDLFWPVESPAIPARRHGVAGAFPTRGNRFDAGGNLQSGYARPPVAPGVIHPDCRCAELRFFRRDVLPSLKLALAVYPEARVVVDEKAGLTLHPSPPPVGERKLASR
jgi:hypothetical protein